MLRRQGAVPVKSPGLAVPSASSGHPQLQAGATTVTLNTDCFGCAAPLLLVKVNSYPSWLPPCPQQLPLGFGGCRGEAQTYFWGEVALWLLPALGLCLRAPADFLKLVPATSSIYCEWQRGLGMCVLDFLWRRLSCKLCSWCMANVFFPETWV